MTSPITLDISMFRQICPEYTNPAVYPDQLITTYWGHAIRIASDEDYGMICGDDRVFMLNILTAHLIALSAQTAARASGQAGGEQGGFVSSSKIDEVSVSKLAPPNKSMLDWWLGQTSRGQELLVLLEVSSVGGLSVGGLPESSAFRKFGGVF